MIGERLTFSRQVLASLVLGIFTGLFFGEAVAPLGIVASGFVRLLQMTVLPYVTLAIIANLGTLTYAQARSLALGAGAVLALIWATALGVALLFPLALPGLDSAVFFSPGDRTRADAFDFLDLYVPTNPFNALANNVVPAVVLFSVLTGLALIGVPDKQPLLDVLHTARTAIARVARFIVRLTPLGIFAIAANAAGTLDVEQLYRLEVYLLGYVAFALLLALWVLPGLVGVLTPIRGLDVLKTSRDSLLTAFLVGDLFVVLPALIESCSLLIETHIEPRKEVAELPRSIIPTAFTFPHSGKLLSITFVLFAGWFSDAEVPVTRYPELVLSGFFSLFGSMNAAVPFLLDQFHIPADTFQLFLATGVVNSRFGTLVAAVHTLAVGLLGSAAIAGRLHVQPRRLLRFAAVTAVLAAAIVVGLRTGFTVFLEAAADGRDVVNALSPIASSPVDDTLVRQAVDVPDAAVPPPGGVLAAIYARAALRVGVTDVIPYAFRNSRSQLTGFDVEMAQQLATDLNVGVEFVRVAQAAVEVEVRRRSVDIVMSGARLTPERAAAFTFSDPYLDETLAVVVPDHVRSRFQSWTAIREMGAIPIGVQDLPYYLAVIRGLVPAAEFRIIPTTSEVLSPDDGIDVYILPAERASVLTMLNPQYTVVVPEGRQVKMPLAYPLAGDDPAWTRYVNAWIALKRRDGFVDRLYDHWILGHSAERRRPRWSILHDVLGWR